MNGDTIKKYFVDTLRDDNEWHRGAIGFPQSEAIAHARELKKQHPTWLVEINAVEIS